MAIASRPWIVSLRARSAVRLDGNPIILRATGSKRGACLGLKLRNMVGRDEAGKTLVYGLAIDAIGEFQDLSMAVENLANAASPFFQILAVAAHAAIDETLDMHVFAPPYGGERGQYLTRTHSEAPGPPCEMRKLPISCLLELTEALSAHPQKSRIERAMAHFRLALSRLEPDNWILAAEHLQIAGETMGGVVLHRKLREADLEDTPQNKRELALRAGLTDTTSADSKLLNKFEALLREQDVFDSDHACYQGLKKASDAFEHGYEGFDEIRSKVNPIADRAFGLVRNAILREAGVVETSALFSEKFRRPLGSWRPIFESEGKYDDSLQPDPDSSLADVTQPWPQFEGLNAHPYVSMIVDHADGSRTVELKAEQNGRSLFEGQRADPLSYQWIYPGQESRMTSSSVERKPL